MAGSFGKERLLTRLDSNDVTPERPPNSRPVSRNSDMLGLVELPVNGFEVSTRIIHDLTLQFIVTEQRYSTKEKFNYKLILHFTCTKVHVECG